MSKSIPFPNSQDMYIRQAITAYKQGDLEQSQSHFRKARQQFSKREDFLWTVVKLFLEVELFQEAYHVAELGDFWVGMKMFSSLTDFDTFDTFLKTNDSPSDFTEGIVKMYEESGLAYPASLKTWLTSGEPVDILPDEITTILVPEIYQDLFDAADDLFAASNLDKDADDTLSDTHFMERMDAYLGGESLTEFELMEVIDKLSKQPDLLSLKRWGQLIERVESRILQSDLILLYIEAVNKPLSVRIKNLLDKPVTVALEQLTPLDRDNYYIAGHKYINQEYAKDLFTENYLYSQWTIYLSIAYPFQNDLALTPEELVAYILQEIEDTDEEIMLTKEQEQQLATIQMTLDHMMMQADSEQNYD